MRKKESVNVNLIVCITLLSCYVMTWVLVFLVPFLGFEADQSDLYISYLLIAEEVLLLACIVVVGAEFVKDMKKKMLKEPNDK